MELDKYILNGLLAQIEELKSSLVEHPAPDFASYMARVGHYNGLKAAIQFVTDSQEEDV